MTGGSVTVRSSAYFTTRATDEHLHGRDKLIQIFFELEIKSTHLLIQFHNLVLFPLLGKDMVMIVTFSGKSRRKIRNLVSY